MEKEKTNLRAQIVNFYKKVAIKNIPTTAGINWDALDWGNYDNDKKNEFVHTLIDFIAREFAKNEFVHHNKNGKVEYSDINYLLEYAPNEYQTPFDFYYTIAYQLYTYSNCIIIPDYKQDDLGVFHISELQVIDGSKYEFGLGYHETLEELFIKIKRLDKGELIALPYNDIIHLRKNPNAMFNGDQNNFLNVAQGYENLLDEAISAELTKLKDNSKIKFVFRKTSGGSNWSGRTQMDEAEKKRTATDVAKRMSDNLIVLDDGEKLEQLSRDINLVDTDKLNHIKSTLFSFYGLTEDLLNGSVDYDKMEIFYNKEILPICIKLSQELTRKFFNREQYKEGQRIIHFHNPLNYVPLANIGDFLYKTSHLFTVNEIRSWKGLASVEGGDVLLQNKNFQTVEQANAWYAEQTSMKGGDPQNEQNSQPV